MYMKNWLLPVLSTGTDQVESAKEKLSTLEKMVNHMVTSVNQWIDDNLLETVITIVLAIIIYAIGQKVIKWSVKLTRHALDRSSVEEGASGFICAILKITLYFILFIMIAGMLGVDTNSFVALIGSAGLSVGLALKGTFSNFAGGLMILLTKPFKVGDYIIAGTFEGEVTKIDIVYTYILTPDNKAIVFPNGDLSNMQLTNSTNEEIRRLDLLIPVAYDTDIDEARAVLLGVCEKNELVIQTEPMQVLLFEFGDSAINLSVRVWTKTEDYWTLKWELQEQIKKGLDQAEISIPFNQLDVTVVQQK